MTTRRDPLTFVSGTPARRAANPLVWSRAKSTFVSTCPKCGHKRPQHGYTRRVLFSLLNKRRKIDAYCIDCNVCWPISESAQTNALVASLPPVRGGQQRESREPNRRNNSPESRLILQLALRTLRGIRHRYEMERAARSHCRIYSVHVALDESDMVWITATIEALERPVAVGVTEAAGRASDSRIGQGISGLTHGVLKVPHTRLS